MQTIDAPYMQPSARGIEPLVTIDEAARILRRSHWSLRLDFKSGRIKFVRMGRCLMVSPNELRRVIQEGL